MKITNTSLSAKAHSFFCAIYEGLKNLARRKKITVLYCAMVFVIASALIICELVLGICEIYSARNENPYSDYYRALIDSNDAEQFIPKTTADRSYISKTTMSFAGYKYAKQINDLFENITDYTMELYGNVRSNASPIVPIEGYDHGLQLYGITYYGALYEYAVGEISLVEGRFIEFADHKNSKDVCVISDELALLNGLKLGDNLSFNGNDDTTHQFKIVGIFKDNIWRDTSQSVFSYQLIQNRVYVPLSALENSPFVSKSSHLFSVANYQIKLDDDRLIDDIEEIINEYRLSGGFRCIFVKVSDLFEAENSGIHALENAFSAVRLVFVAIALAVILIFVYFIIRSRKREFGIYLALGAGKAYAAVTAVIELAAASLLGISLAYGAAMLYGTRLANSILGKASSITSAEAIKDTTSQAYLSGITEEQVFDSIIDSGFISDISMQAMALAAVIILAGIICAAIRITATKPIYLLSGKEQ